MAKFERLPCDHPGKESSRTMYEKGCRGIGCFEARRKVRQEHEARKKAGLVTPMPPPEHGTMRMYRRGCKCDACMEANRLKPDKRHRTPRTDFVRGVTPAGPPPRKTTTPVLPKAKTAPKLKMVASKAVQEKVTMTATPADDCGEPLPTGGYCRRLYPCAVHSEAQSA